MHDLAPNVMASDRAAIRGLDTQAGTPEHSAPEVSATVHRPPHAAPKRRRDSRPVSHVPAIADLDEGDVLLHVLGTGLGPTFCAFVCETALRLGLRGWARCESGALTFRVVGREPELAALVHEIRIHAPADCSVRAIEPDVGDGGAPLPEHGFIPIIGECAAAPLLTGTTSAAGPDW